MVPGCFAFLLRVYLEINYDEILSLFGTLSRQNPKNQYFDGEQIIRII